MKSRTEKIDQVLHALANPTRRKMFELLSFHGQRTARELYQPLYLTQQGAAQHLTILERAGLVTVARKPHERAITYRPRLKGMAPLTYWLTDRAVECPKPNPSSPVKNSPQKPSARRNSGGSHIQST